MPGRAFVGGSEVKVTGHHARGVLDDHQGRRDRVADTDGRVAPRHPVSVGREAHAERTVDLLGPQPCRGRVDLRLGRGHLGGVGLRADGRVDQCAHRICQRLVGGLQALHVGRTQALDMGVTRHLSTRTRSCGGVESAGHNCATNGTAATPATSSTKPQTRKRMGRKLFNLRVGHVDPNRLRLDGSKWPIRVPEGEGPRWRYCAELDSGCR